MLSISPLLAWFFTLILLLLAGRAAARLALARGATTGHPLEPIQRNRELGHVAMSLGMAVLLAPGLPRPPQAGSVCFFTALAALAAIDWGRRQWERWRGRTTDSCGPAEGGRLLDPHHAIVGAAMVAMLLRPAAGGVAGGSGGAAAAMPGMAMGATPNAAILFFLAYIWIAALVLGYGMTRVLAATQQADRGAGASGGGLESVALLASPATVYACELAMTVLTGLMLLD